MNCIFFMSRKRKTGVILKCLLFLSVMVSMGWATVATIDADGGAEYSILDDVMNDIRSGALIVDTILFTGADQDSFVWLQHLDSVVLDNGLTIRSDKTDPELFPIIRKTGSDMYMFLKSNDLFIDHVIFSACSTGWSLDATIFNTSDLANGRIFSFKNCIIRNTDPGYHFFYLQGGNSTTSIFENCLFTGNEMIYTINTWGGQPALNITNCTFDNNTRIFTIDNIQTNNYSFKNNIFFNNTETFPSNSLRAVTTYSFTSEALTGYGTGCVSGDDPLFAVSTRTKPTHWRIRLNSPAKDIGTSTGAPSIDLGGGPRIDSIDAGCWEFMSSYTWDISDSSSIQAGSGTWGTNSYWTLDGTSLVAWPGAGNSATFAGTNGTYTVTVSGTQNVDSISFVNSGYTLSSGTINLGTKNGIYAGATSVIGAVISGTNGIAKYGTGTLTLSGANTYTGVTTVSEGALRITNGSALGGTADGVAVVSGARLELANNITVSNETATLVSGDGGNFRGSLQSQSGNNTWAGPVNLTENLVRIGTQTATLTISGAIDDGASSYDLVISCTDGTVILSGTNTYSGKTRIYRGTLKIAGADNRLPVGTELILGNTTNTDGFFDLNGFNQTIGGLRIDDASRINSQIINNGASASILTINNSSDYIYAGKLDNGTSSLAITKSGTGTLTLSGINTYTGATTVSTGMLNVTGSITGSAVSVSSGATLTGNGTISGSVNIAGGGRITPGNNGAGTLSTGALTLTSTSVLNFELGTNRDSIKATGVTLDGTLNITDLAGFGTGNYTIIKYSGTLVNNQLVMGTAPEGYSYTITASSGSVIVTVAAPINSPTDITLSKDSVLEKQSVGTFVGILTALDPDPGETFIYDLVSGSGSADNASFLISNDSLYTNDTLDFIQKNELSIRIRVTDSDTNIYEEAFPIYVVAGPYLLSEPADTLIGEGDDILFSAEVTGTPPFSYAWYQAGLPTVIASSATLLLENVNVSLSGTGYYCIVTNANGADTSRTAMLTVLALPVLVSNPADTTVIAGNNASFSVTATGEQLSYVWTKDNKSDTLGTLPTLSLTSVSQSDSGSTYKCRVSNAAGSVISSPAMLHVISPPLITTQPLSDTASDGDTVAFVISASGTAPLTYQWYRNGTDLVGAETTLELTGVTLTDDGSYYECMVTNPAGMIISDRAYLTVNSAGPLIIVQPSSKTVLEGGVAIFTVAASGTPPFTYKWYKTGSSTMIDSSDSLVLSDVATSDSGSSYYCVVFNAAGTDTSNSATLHVGTVPPIINLHPESQTVYAGDSALFFIQATGTDTLLYTWYRDGFAAELSTNDTLIVQSVTKADSGNLYYCIVSNGAGVDTSLKALLIVYDALSAPVITLQPVSQTKLAGGSVSFVVTAIGTPLPKYQWQLGGENMVGETDSVLTLTGLQLSDDGLIFRCLVYNSVDTVFSETAVLNIEQPPTAQFSAQPASGYAPLTVSFTDSSMGTVSSYSWDFGDGSKSTVANPQHQYISTGRYSVKLVVTGPSGTDSIIKTDFIYVYSEGDNPVQITARYLGDTDVEIVLKNLADIDTTFPPPWVDSLGLWIKENTLPKNTSSSTLFAVYSSAELLSKGAKFTDTITLPTTSELFGLMTGLYWNDGSISVFNEANGSMILLLDTIPPQNLLSISGSHLGADSALVSLSNVLSIDTQLVDSIGVTYSLDSAALSFSGSPVKWFTSQQITSGGTGQFSFVIYDSIFTGESKKVWSAVVLKGKNDLLSSSVKSVFTTISPSVNNPVILSATAINSSGIVLSWPKLTDSTITRIRLWKGKTEIPLGSVNPSAFDSVRVFPSDTAYTFTNLESSTRYYFAAQVLTGSTWSPVTVNARASAQTLVPTDTTQFRNFIHLKPLFFDTLSASIIVSWCLDSSVTEGFHVGITYSHSGYPGLPLDPQIETVKSECDSAVLKLNSILFDTTYYVALWLRKTDGNWKDPTDSSKKSLTTPPFTREIVTFFRTDVSKDTVRAFNSTVVLWKDETFATSVITTDTLSAYQISNNAYEGMIPVGTGFYFRKNDPIPALFIGLHYNSIPQGYDAGSIRIYRDKGGVPYLEHGSIVDPSSDMVYVKTSDLNDPFMLMIDTMAPQVTIESDTGSIALTLSDLIDTVVMSDNINNLYWKFVFGKGDELPSHVLSDTLQNIEQSKILVIPSELKVVSQDNGVRALLIVSDGTHVDTINMSRRVHREESDHVTTAGQEWFPLSVTADLENTEPESLIVKLAEEGSTDYDLRNMRLYRWIATQFNTPANRWVEYDTSNSSLFNFTPSRLIWVKTLKNRPVHFGPGNTVSLKEDYKITLPSEEWTDIGLPFKFNIRVADILEASNDSGFVQIYSWVKDSTSRKFFTSGVFIPGLPDKENRNIVLNATDGNGFSIYNSDSKDITINIPPIPIVMSPLRTQAKTANTRSWSVKVISSTADGAVLPEVYCGYSPGNTLINYPAAPSFLSSRVMIYDRAQSKSFGHYVSGDFNGAIAKEIVFVNEGSAPVKINYTLGKTGAFPSGISASVLNPSSGKWESSGAVTVAAKSSQYRWLLASDDTYKENFHSNAFTFKYSLQHVYPNPFRTAVNIKFSAPANVKEKISFAIYDALGRRMWERTIHGALNAGEYVLTWNGQNSKNKQVQAGTYFLNMTVHDSNGKVLRKFDSRMTYLP